MGTLGGSLSTVAKQNICYSLFKCYHKRMFYLHVW